MIKGLRMSDFSPGGKALATGVLLFFTGVHGFALWLSHEVGEAAGSAQAHFSYKDLIYLLRMSHQHLFGHGVMYFLTGALFLTTQGREEVKTAVVLLPFVGAGLDLGSWWLLKYNARDWESLSMISGTLFTASFLYMVVVSLWQLWRRPHG
jgi:hypothetical protein